MKSKLQFKKFEEFVSRDEISQPRTPYEYILWFEDKLKITSEPTDELKKQGILHQGIAKVFYEELFPLYRLLQNKVEDWGQAKFIPIIGNQNFDVEVVATGSSIPKYIEITTTTVNEDEHNRMEYFLEHKSVDLLGAVSIQKNPERKILVENGLVCANKIDQIQKDRIKIAIEAKSKVMDRNLNTVLLVCFDDYTYFPFHKQKSKHEMDSFLDTLAIPWITQYESLYIIGISGKSLWVRT